MSAPKHTPGPWEFHTQPYGDRIPGGHDHSIQSDDGVIALIDPPGHPASEFKANARLMAAAPDMLLALELVRDAVREDGTQRLTFAKLWAMRAEMVERAIAKATGGTLTDAHAGKDGVRVMTPITSNTQSPAASPKGSVSGRNDGLLPSELSGAREPYDSALWTGRQPRPLIYRFLVEVQLAPVAVGDRESDATGWRQPEPFHVASKGA